MLYLYQSQYLSLSDGFLAYVLSSRGLRNSSKSETILSLLCCGLMNVLCPALHDVKNHQGEVESCFTIDGMESKHDWPVHLSRVGKVKERETRRDEKYLHRKKYQYNVTSVQKLIYVGRIYGNFCICLVPTYTNNVAYVCMYGMCRCAKSNPTPSLDSMSEVKAMKFAAWLGLSCCCLEVCMLLCYAIYTSVCRGWTTKRSG